MTNPRSTASIGGHPLHPMVIPFPIVCFIGTFVCDLVMLHSTDPFWMRVSLYLLGAGLIMAAVAAVLGLIDVFGDVQIRNLSDAWWHAGANILAVLLELYNFYIRYSPTGSEKTTGLVISALVVCILLFSGWKGWGMVYKHHVAVSDVAERPN
jgi:uncharacterized membrane protein